MNFSDDCSYYLLDIYSNTSYVPTLDIEDLTLDSSTVYNKFLSVDISNSQVEIPIFYRTVIENYIYGGTHPSTYNTDNVAEEIVIPLYCDVITHTKKSPVSIIKELFYYTSIYCRLKKIITNSGEVYYGGRGLILDKDFTPLFMSTLIGEKHLDSPNLVFTYNKSVIYIHPKVFLSDDFINKIILRKVIPVYLTKPVHIHVRSKFKNNLVHHFTPQIIVKDVSNWFKKINPSEVSKCSNENLNQILINNVDDVLNQIFRYG